jgi:mxaJ protein
MKGIAAIIVLLANAAASPRVAELLRVCSDPNNLPFSNNAREGFENRIAELLARDVGLALDYTWWAQRRGFILKTLNAGICDVVIGLPADIDMAATTQPYYRSTYVFLTRRSRALDIRSFDDAALRRLRIGVQVIGDDGTNSPPAHALSRRHIVDNLVGYSVYGDYRSNSPPSRIVKAVIDGDVDVAVVWGPLAGFFAAQQREPLEVVPVPSAVDSGLPMVYAISMAVRRSDTARLAQLNDFLRRRQRDIDRILDEYHVPQVPPREGSR